MPEATPGPVDMVENAVRPGQTVWASGVVGFPDEVMKAEVLDVSVGFGTLSFERHGEVDASQCVWIRQLPTPAAPISGEPWQTRWPVAKLLGI